MRHRTPKRQARDEAARQYREEMLHRVPWCDVCLQRPSVDVHEIARGPCREAAQDKPFATLATCRQCHDGVLSESGIEAERWQLALLRKRRPGDFDLAAYNHLKGYGPRRITLEDLP